MYLNIQIILSIMVVNIDFVDHPSYCQNCLEQKIHFLFIANLMIEASKKMRQNMIGSDVRSSRFLWQVAKMVVG